LVVGYPDSSYNRKTVAELASAKGTDPVSLIIDMIRTAGPGIRVIVTAMDEPDLRTFAAHPLVMISSDGAIRSGHPRAYGAFPRVLARYVRETGVLPLPEAIAKMTGRSAKLLGFADRGTIAPGKKADLLVFDPARVQDHATQLNPTALSTGIDYVIVNGQIVLDAGKLTGNRPGRALRRR
jgi:N-acyl-D-amino-acid deacylase